MADEMWVAWMVISNEPAPETVAALVCTACGHRQYITQQFLDMLERMEEHSPPGAGFPPG